MKYTSQEIQDISSNFRNVARRLSRTDYSQCDANLKRFIKLVDNEPIIKEFIENHNKHSFDIEEIISSRELTAPFNVSPEIDEEISFEYQLLKYAIEKYDGDFTRLYGTHWYTSFKSTVNDEMSKFINHIIDPLIDFIGDYLRNCYDKAICDEKKNEPINSGGITANYSTVVVAQTVGGAVSNNVEINEGTVKQALEIVATIKNTLLEENSKIDSDVLDVLNQIEKDIKENNKPKKGFLVALKGFCSGSAAVITLINSLIKLFSIV